jgi:hypothetical protein
MSAIGRSPSGVAIGVSGEAQTGGGRGHVLVFSDHRQNPSWHDTFTPHVLVTQVVPDAKVHRAPSFGTTGGHGAPRTWGELQSHTSAPSGDPLQLGTHPGWLQQLLQVQALPSE